MPVTVDDVRHVAALARLGLDDDRARALAAELDTILRHMAVLSSVETEGIPEHGQASVAALPLRPDQGPPIPMARVPAEFAPRMRDGFFLVPRLSTHEDQEAP
jgi:aspartyl-tRNA(Asn)/glutamyl-tRNA(Gln) amidotransferase subunit C